MVKVVIAGAGIVGSALALSLARRGCQVRVLDASPCSGATKASWAWLNANKKNPRHYKELNMQGMDEWARSFPSLTQRCGAILLDDPHPSTDPTYPCEALTPQRLLAMEPALSADALAARPAHLYPQEGWVDPEQACSSMLEEAGRLGAQLLREDVRELLLAGTCSDSPAGPRSGGPKEAGPARVVGVCTGGGERLDSDVVLLTCGPAVAALAAQAGVAVPMLHKPARVALTSRELPAGTLTRLLCARDVFVLQRPDGSFMLGEPYECADESTAQEVGEAMLEKAVRLLPALSQVKVESVQVGYRPFPQDGHPIVGFATDGLYVCTTHSGMTLAPVLAKLAAQEIASRGSSLAPELAPYRPQRSFDSSVKAYGWDLYGETKAEQQVLQEIRA